MNLQGCFGFSEAESAAETLLGIHKTGRNMFTLNDLKSDNEKTGLLILMSRGFLVQQSNMSAHGYFSFTDAFWNRIVEVKVK